MRPAVIDTLPGSKAESPRAMTIGVNELPDGEDAAAATVDLPAPFGPARMTTSTDASVTSRPCLLQFVFER